MNVEATTVTVPQGNGELPASREAAVHQGLTYYQETAAERDRLAAEVAALKTSIAAYKVAIDALETQLEQARSQAMSATLVRDQAVADRCKWESLFVALNAQLKAFAPPTAPLVTAAAEDAAKPGAQAVRAAALTLGMVLLASGARAASACSTLGEARAAHPDAHLYWHLDGRQRCWDDRRGRSHTRPSHRERQRRMDAPAPLAMVTEAEPPPAPLELPPGLMPLREPPQPLEDDPRWSWIKQARTAEREPQPEAQPPAAPPAPMPPPPSHVMRRLALSVAVGVVAGFAGLLSWRRLSTNQVRRPQ